MRRVLIAALALAVALPSLAQVPAEDLLVQRFLDRKDTALVSYRATRRLEASNARFKKHGWMEVAVELTPERGFTYTVLAEGGSDYIRDKVLRKALAGEAAAVRAKEPDKAALTPANYLLASGAPAIDGGSATIRIRPRRADMFLVDGLVTVTADADIIRVEGRLAKTPSFWTRRVDVVRHYGRVEGVRVPLGMESTAEVRIVGTSMFRMTSTYLEVNGVPATPAAAP